MQRKYDNRYAPQYNERARRAYHEKVGDHSSGGVDLFGAVQCSGDSIGHKLYMGGAATLIYGFDIAVPLVDRMSR